MSGLNDAIQYIAGSVDKPGRAVRGVLAGKPHEALAALPFSDTLGITDPANATSGRNLTDQYGLTNKHDRGWGAWGMGLGADLATDPLSLIGTGILGKGLAASKFGRSAAGHAARFGADEGGWLKFAPEGIPEHLHNALDGMGPMYPGGHEKLQQLSLGLNDRADRQYWGQLIKDPEAARVAAEIRPGSKHIASGNEGFVLRSPGGGVLRIGHFSAMGPEYAGVRPNLQEVLQPYRSMQAGRFHVEHLPYVDTAAKYPNKLVHHLHDQLTLKGMDPWDVNASNVSRTAEGNIVVHDPGAIIGHGQSARPSYPFPDEATRTLLEQMGGVAALRRSLSQGIQHGTIGQGVRFP